MRKRIPKLFVHTVRRVHSNKAVRVSAANNRILTLETDGLFGESGRDCGTTSTCELVAHTLTVLESRDMHSNLLVGVEVLGR